MNANERELDTIVKTGVTRVIQFTDWMRWLRGKNRAKT